MTTLFEQLSAEQIASIRKAIPVMLAMEKLANDNRFTGVKRETVYLSDFFHGTNTPWTKLEWCVVVNEADFTFTHQLKVIMIDTNTEQIESISAAEFMERTNG